MNKNRTTETTAFGSLAGGLIYSLILVLVGAAPVQAQWSFEPVLKVGGEKDDNATLSVRTDNVKDVTGLLLDAQARINYQSPLTSFYVTPRVRSRNYSDYPEIDSDDVFLESRFSRNTTNSTWSFRFNYDEQPVRTAERSDVDLNVDDPVEIPDDDTGFVNLQDDRKRLLFTPGWKYNFSDSTSMNVSLSYLDTTYAESLQLVLNDFTDTRLRISMDRAFSERTTGIILATARTYDIEDLATDTQGVGIQAGFERALSSTTSFRALVGIEDTESDISSVDPTFTADVSLRRRLETVNVLAQYRRTVNANGSGRLSVRDAVNLNLSRRLSEKVTAGLGVRAHQSNSLDEILTIDERDFIQLRSQFIWNLSSNFAAEFDYRYTFQKRSALPESANSNQIMLWLIYQPNSIDRRFAAGRL